MGILKMGAFLSLIIITMPFLYSSTYLENVLSSPTRGPIEIYQDGSVTAGAPITRTGNDYSLTDDITEGIEIHCSNIRFDGADHSLTSDSGTGILLKNVTNVTVSNHTIKDNSGYGILMENCDECRLIDNLFFNNSRRALEIDRSSDNIFLRNNFTCNTKALQLTINQSSKNNQIDSCMFLKNNISISLGKSINTTLRNSIVLNTTSNVALHFGGDKLLIDNCTFKEGDYFNFVVFQSASNVLINNTCISDGGTGLSFDDSSNCSIRFSRVMNNYMSGCRFHQDDNFTISNCYLSGNERGIVAMDMGNISISNCTISNNTYMDGPLIGMNNVHNFSIKGNNLKYHVNSIVVRNSSDGIISGNTLVNCSYGILADRYTSSNIRIYQNDLYNCEYGIWLPMSTSTLVYHNNDHNPQGSAFFDPSSILDNGYPSGGNYWSFYDEVTEGAVDINGDGIADNPLGFNNDAVYDRYPLMRPFGTNPPIANFTFQLDNSTAYFDSHNSYDRDGELNEYIWDLGDGSSESGPSPEHFYLRDGTFDISLKVVDDGGFIDYCNRTRCIVVEDRPRLIEDTSDLSGTTGDPFRFRIDAYDNFGVDTVETFWSHGYLNGTEPLREKEGRWEGEIELGNSTEELMYSFRISDANGIFSVSHSTKVPVRDNDEPVFLEDLSDPYGVVDSDYHFMARFHDNIDVSSVNVEVTLNDISQFNRSMDKEENGTWSYTYIGFKGEGGMEYRFHFEDASGNRNRSEWMEADVYLSDGPIFLDIIIDEEPFTGENWSIKTRVRDNFGVERVWLEYSLNEEHPDTEEMHYSSEKNIWELQIEIPLEAVSLEYRLNAIDTSENMNLTGFYWLDIIDTVDPLILDMTDSLPETGERFLVHWHASDNIGVASVEMEYWFQEGNTMNISDGSRSEGSFSLEIPDDSLIPLNYILSVEDLSGRVVELDMKTLSIVDDHLPEIIDRTPILHQRGSALVFEFDIKDNIGLRAVYLHYRYSSEDEESNRTFNEAEKYTFSILTPYGNIDDIHYTITAVDRYGNVNRTDEITVDLTDRIEGDDFPDDPAASLDTDGDGYPDEWNPGMTRSDSTTGLRTDDFPNDPAASLDSDGDGHPDEWNPGMTRSDSTTDLELDEFPEDPNEWADTDGDGIGDNADFLPSINNGLAISLAIILMIVILLAIATFTGFRIDLRRFRKAERDLRSKLEEMKERGMDISNERRALKELNPGSEDKDLKTEGRGER